MVLFMSLLMCHVKSSLQVATPGRLVDHLSNTKGFSLRTLKYLVKISPMSHFNSVALICFQYYIVKIVSMVCYKMCKIMFMLLYLFGV